jgi:hypothetical protein
LTFWASKRNVVVSIPIFSFRRKEAVSTVTTYSIHCGNNIATPIGAVDLEKIGDKKSF